MSGTHHAKKPGRLAGLFASDARIPCPLLCVSLSKTPELTHTEDVC